MEEKLLEHNGFKLSWIVGTDRFTISTEKWSKTIYYEINDLQFLSACFREVDKDIIKSVVEDMNKKRLQAL